MYHAKNEKSNRTSKFFQFLFSKRGFTYVCKTFGELTYKNYVYYFQPGSIVYRMFWYLFAIKVFNSWADEHFPYIYIHSKTPYVVSVLWQDSDDVVTILLPTRNLVEGYKTVYLCHLDSCTVTVCNGYLVSSHVATLQLPTRCVVDRFLHRPHGSGYLITCVSDVVTVL